MTLKNKYKTLILIFIVIIIGTALRLYHIEFGLPHSFHADEPEIAELAIKYTYEFRKIVSNGNYYKFIPISYVYGTFPTYLLTIFTMAFSKTGNLLGINFDKTSIYIFLRSLTALVSVILVPIGYLFAQKLFNSRTAGFITAFLVALNWKFIVHAHYVNADIILTVLLAAAFYSFYIFYRTPKNQVKKDTFYVTVTGILFGLAVGTKITALISLPLFLYIFIRRKDYRGLFAFLFIIFGSFAVSNPFSILYANDFALRIYEMLGKEAGMVFDSVDYSPIKYLNAIVTMATLPVFLFSLYGIYHKLRFPKTENLAGDVSISTDKTDPRVFDKFLIGNIIVYLIFYSIQSRRVDRWLLPMIPVLMIYASYGIIMLKQQTRKLWFYLGSVITVIYYLVFPALLLFQFQKDTPKSAAYLWMQKNTTPESNKLIYTEEGLDPMNKLQGELVLKYEVYTSENAQFFLPENPEGWDYIVLSSRPMQNFKKPEVEKKYPFYTKKWKDFESKVLDPNNFELIKEFTLPKPNLVELSDVYIYKNLNPTKSFAGATDSIVTDKNIIDNL